MEMFKRTLRLRAPQPVSRNLYGAECVVLYSGLGHVMLLFSNNISLLNAKTAARKVFFYIKKYAVDRIEAWVCCRVCY